MTLLSALTAGAAGLTAGYLRCEYRSAPEGIGERSPRLSWELTAQEGGAACVQRAYRILVASSEEALARDEGDLWDSGKVLSDATGGIVYAGRPLRSQQVCHWKVQVWDGGGEPSPWSAPARWSMGLLEFRDREPVRWIARRIRTAPDTAGLVLPPARYFRTAFTVDKPVRRAVAYASAKGIYELRLNGRQAGCDYFTPGWTDYRKRIYYNTYDVTGLLRPGENVAGAVVADGWYAGYVGFGILERLERSREFYGIDPALFCRIEIEYADGTTQSVMTGPGWKSSEGPVRQADLLMGEVYDARREQPGWDAPGFDDSAWEAAELSVNPDGALEAAPTDPVREAERIVPVAVVQQGPGVWIFDMGRNFAGTVLLKVRGGAGRTLMLRYGEMLNADGSLMTENLRHARATDFYTLRDGGQEWSPRMTYHGFRYVELSGLESEPGAETLTGIVLTSPTPRAGTFECGSELVNRLWRNITTTQQANFFEIPTDCPQRDERLGWTGDIQIYARSATYNADVASFLSKWLVDLDDAQRSYGAYPSYAPYPYAIPMEYAPAWMDAGVIVPWTLWQVYGDTRAVRRAYPGMKRFMDFLEQGAQGDLQPAVPTFGDWLAVGRTASDDFIASAYYAYDAALMAEMAGAVGERQDSLRYVALAARIREAFARRYIASDGLIPGNDCQTAYALALCFGLYPEPLAQAGADRLAAMIEANGGRFSTGFLGTKHVMMALSQYGHDDVAYGLLLQTEYPGWGYSILNGATSIWERWDSYTREYGFGGRDGGNNARMNSFSHYAFGSVAEWMFRYALGIDTEGPGYRHILLRPRPDARIGWMKGSYRSVSGEIVSEWEVGRRTTRYRFVVPPNTRATLSLPGQEPRTLGPGEHEFEFKNRKQ